MIALFVNFRFMSAEFRYTCRFHSTNTTAYDSDCFWRSGFLNVMNVIMNGFNQSFTIYGFTLSFWDVWLWSIIGAIVAAFIGGMLK